MEGEMQICPNLMMFVVKKDLLNVLVTHSSLCYQSSLTDLFVEIFKVHEKESKNNNHGHKVRQPVSFLIIIRE